MKDWFSLCFPIGLLLCGSASVMMCTSRDSERSIKTTIEADKLDPEATYYVFVSELETHSKTLDGDKEGDWDDEDDAPDLFYQVLFEGKKIFQSSQRDDCFIATWRGVTVPIALQDLPNLVKGDVSLEIDFEKIMTAARVKGDASLTLKMFDYDRLTPTDDVGELTLQVSDLHEGTNEIINQDRRKDNGWKRLEIKVVKREGSVKDYLLPLLREMTTEPQANAD